MIRVFLTIFLVGLLSLADAQTSDSGIFMTVKCGKKMPRKTVLLTEKQICIAPNPIITTSEFSDISEVKQKEQTIYFDLTFTEKGLGRINQIMINLPNSTLALVVDSQVFSSFEASGSEVNRTFRFEASMRHQQAFFDIQERLKQQIKGS